MKSLPLFSKPAAIAVMALGALGLAGWTVYAQPTDVVRPPIIIDPPRVPPPWNGPLLNQELQLQSESAQVEIKGATARTKLTQVFQNTTGRRIEGTYVFPLPEGAAVTGFAMTVNGKRMEAEILDGDKAREIYTGIVQKMRDPAILEFIDRNLVKARIFPIDPGAQQTMELEYSEGLRAEGNAFRYVVPLRLPLGGAARKASVDIKVSSAEGIKAVYSPTHDVEIKRDGDTARITGEWGTGLRTEAINEDQPQRRAGGSDRDFVLYYTTSKDRVGVNLVTYREAGEDGYFMMLVAPDPNLAAREIAAKDVIFVFDTSGSMQGEKIEQARKALLGLIGNLNANDRFNLVTFSSDVRTFRDGLQSASKENLDAAREWAGKIKAVGGTNINEALTESAKMLRGSADGARPQQIIFMTDGQPTVGETDVAQILKNVREANASSDKKNDLAARLFVFGVGYDVNTRLLDTLAADNRGSSDYVLPSEDIEQKVGSLYNKIAFPVLASPRVDWNGMKVFDVYPKNLPDLFKGTQTVVFGRYEGKNTVTPQLIGLVSGKEERIAGQGDFSGEGKLNDVIPRLWATRKVGYLLDEARMQNRTVDGEVKDEIIKLSKKFGIVTPFTAGLITEDERNITTTRPVPLPGVTFSAPATGAGGFGGMAREDSGRNAVLSSRASKVLKDGDKIDDTMLQSSAVRNVEGKTFVLRDGVWTDADYDAAKKLKVEAVKFASTQYFALLQDARMAKWLSVGDKVLVVYEGRALRIEP